MYSCLNPCITFTQMNNCKALECKTHLFTSFILQQQAESSTGFLSIFTFSLSLQSAESYFRLSSSTDVCRVFHLLFIFFILRPSFEDVLSSGCVVFFWLLWVDLRDCFYLFICLSVGREFSRFLIPCVPAAQTYPNWKPFCSFMPKPTFIFLIYKSLRYSRAGPKFWKP